MLTIGLDVHQTKTAVCILGPDGKRIKQFMHIGHPRDLIEKLVALGEPFRVGFESSCGSGTLHDLLAQVAQEVVVAHPGRLRLIFQTKKKNDRIDAQKIALLLLLDELPRVHVPNVEVRAWRELIMTREQAVRRQTAIKNSSRALLRSHLVKAPRQLWSQAGLAWLQTVELPTQSARLRRDLAINELRFAQDQIKRLDQELNRIGRAQPRVHLLQTIPGVGPRTAEALCAFIDDPSRFRAKKIGSYFGLIPCETQSCKDPRRGHITREGPAVVRRLLTQAAWIAIRRSPTIKAQYERIVRGDKQRRKIALVAIAHYLARVALAMLQTGEPWRHDAASEEQQPSAKAA